MATKKTSTKFDTAHNIETEADLTNKTAVVKNLVTGEKYAASDAITVESKSITENGTYTAPAGKAYSPVTVNVESGGGDFSTAEVTIIATAGTGSIVLSGGIGGGSEGFGFLTANDAIKTTAGADAGTTVTHRAILIKGEAVYEPILGTIISTTGGITHDSDENILIVTGDGTITADPTDQ